MHSCDESSEDDSEAWHNAMRWSTNSGSVSSKVSVSNWTCSTREVHGTADTPTTAAHSSSIAWARQRAARIASKRWQVAECHKFSGPAATHRTAAILELFFAAHSFGMGATSRGAHGQRFGVRKRALERAM